MCARSRHDAGWAVGQRADGLEGSAATSASAAERATMPLPRRPCPEEGFASAGKEAPV